MEVLFHEVAELPVGKAISAAGMLAPALVMGPIFINGGKVDLRILSNGVELDAPLFLSALSEAVLSMHLAEEQDQMRNQQAACFSALREKLRKVLFQYDCTDCTSASVTRTARLAGIVTALRPFSTEPVNVAEIVREEIRRSVSEFAVEIRVDLASRLLEAVRE